MSMKFNSNKWPVLAVGAMILLLASCVHQPILPDDGTGNGTDTTTTNQPCDPDTVYFKNDILPLLNSSCGMNGCHSEASAQDGVIMTNYNYVVSTGRVSAGNPGNSELYEVIVETDPDKIMPPPNSGITLTADQKSMIYTWIAQGAKNNGCDPNFGNCDTTNVTFSAKVAPVIQNKCQGCHSNTLQSGGVNLEGHANIQAYALNGRLYGSISHAAGYKAMPQGQPKMDDCTILIIKKWIDDGAPNN